MKKISFLFISALFLLSSCKKDVVVVPPDQTMSMDGVYVDAYLNRDNPSPEGNMDMYDLIIGSDYTIGPADVEIYHFADRWIGGTGGIEIYQLSTKLCAGENILAEIKLGQITEIYINGMPVYDIWQQNWTGKSDSKPQRKKVKRFTQAWTPIVKTK